ncbi:hypothetical protein [Nocardia shimofusensis]|uniref:hypothetical protein n=1 Tax=Nocardia shimofusensis TaxID=228596 RepID=UPI000AF9F13C|nr:hypothetical protein [Nocardia shimofusensis]
MVSEDDAKDRDTDRPGSRFGPPVGDFGPPVDDFGPPVGDFGPPVDEFGGPSLAETGPMWKPPADTPEIGWRPADGSLPPASPVPAPPVAPPPAPQPASADPTVNFAAPAADPFRAPDSSGFADAPAAASTDPERDVSVDETVRYSTESAAPAGKPASQAKPGQGGPQRWWNSPTESGDVPKPPETAGAPAGLSWADDPIAKRLAPKPAATASGGGSGSAQHISTRKMLIGIAIVVVLLIALVVTIVSLSGDDETGRSSGPNSTAALSCPPNRSGKVVVGNGQGSTASGADAIMGFQYAFYVERDGERVRDFVAADAANISSAPIIQKAIDEQIPVGTTHCLRITEVASDTFDVDLTEHRPDGTTTVYPQRVTTVEREGKILVTAIDGRA